MNAKRHLPPLFFRHPATGKQASDPATSSLPVATCEVCGRRFDDGWHTLPPGPCLTDDGHPYHKPTAP